MFEQKDIKPYLPSDEQRKAIRKVYDSFQHCIIQRDKSYSYFDEYGLEEYIDESVRRYNSYLPRRDEYDPRTNVFMPETRNKVNIIAAFVAAQRPRVDITARSKNKVSDKQLATILSSLYEYYMDKENGDEKFLHATTEALVKGTSVVYEGYDYNVREIKEVTGYNWDTGKVTYEKQDRIEADNCFQRIIPLEDFFIENFYEPDIQKQPRVNVRELIEYSTFMDRYGSYPAAQHVPTKGMFVNDKSGEYYFWEDWSDRVDDPQVELVHFYEKMTDTYLIVANGVLLTEPDNPIMFDHKDYPFSVMRYETMAPDFFYGKSLPQKIVSPQDVYNELTNVMLDRARMSSMPALVTSLTSEIEEDEVGSFQIIQTADPNGLRELNFSANQPGDIQIAEGLRGAIDRSTVDSSVSGEVSGETATAILQARSANIQNLGLFLVNIYSFVYDHAKQRLANTLQFTTKPSKLRGSNSDKFEMKEIVMDDQVLSDGENGVRVIRIVGDSKDIPTEEERTEDVLEQQERTGQNVETVYITPNMLQDIDWMLKIVPGSSIPETKALTKAMALEYANTALSMFPGLADPEPVFDFVTEAFEQNPDDYKIEQQPAGPEGPIPPELAQALQAEAGGEVPQQSELVQQIAGTQGPDLNQLLELPPQ